jgi:hypothetical protein
MEPAPPIVDRLSKCQTRMEPRQPRLLPETLRSSIASPNAPPSHYVRHRCRTFRTLIRGAIDFRPWNRADSRRLAHHSAALDTAHETVPVLNFSHTILRRESIMILPDYIPNAQVLGHPLHTMPLHTLNLSCLQEFLSDARTHRGRHLHAIPRAVADPCFVEPAALACRGRQGNQATLTCCQHRTHGLQQ